MTPTPDQILRARIGAQLTQTQAAAIVYCSLRTWQSWEAGHAKMHPAMWELFNLKVKK